MLSGSTISTFHVGNRIGQGSFGEIYVVRSTVDNHLYALKVEPANTARKILEFEIMVLKKINPSPFFPKYIASGTTNTHYWCVMELLGPSLTVVLKRLPSHRLSLSSGLRVATLILRALKSFHEIGFIHRDIKPSNILLRPNREFPIALIDFGLSKIYLEDGKIIPARAHPGFRGTAVYASPNAHMHLDLARRDDLISWYYLIIDIITGSLPWKSFDGRAEILHLKRTLSMAELGSQIVPQFGQIWNKISQLKFEDRPDYEGIDELLIEAQRENNIAEGDEWDWHPQILQMDGNDETCFQQRKISSSEAESTGKIRKHSDLNREPLIKNDEETDCCCLLM